MYHFFGTISTYSHSLPLRENGTQFVYNSKMQQIRRRGTVRVAHRTDICLGRYGPPVFFSKLFGTVNDRKLKEYQPVVDKINLLEERFKKLANIIKG